MAPPWTPVWDGRLLDTASRAGSNWTPSDTARFRDQYSHFPGFPAIDEKLYAARFAQLRAMVHPWPTREWDQRLLDVWTKTATREHPHWTSVMTGRFRSLYQDVPGFPRPDSLFLDRFKRLYKLMGAWRPSKKKKANPAPQPIDLDPDFDLDEALAFDFGTGFNLDKFFENVERLPSTCSVLGCSDAVFNQTDVLCQYHDVHGRRRGPMKRKAPDTGIADWTI
tara:strand:- start:1167 stop:1835 length:669 start_codon:yes stop_codon:yes gene_type:complete